MTSNADKQNCTAMFVGVRLDYGLSGDKRDSCCLESIQNAILPRDKNILIQFMFL
jgi:hypothetical protein